MLDRLDRRERLDKQDRLHRLDILEKLDRLDRLDSARKPFLEATMCQGKQNEALIKPCFMLRSSLSWKGTLRSISCVGCRRMRAANFGYATVPKTRRHWANYVWF